MMQGDPGMVVGVPEATWEKILDTLAHRAQDGLLSPQTLRIEALRAAAILIAAQEPADMERPVAATLEVARQFVRWLETGQR